MNKDGISYVEIYIVDDERAKGCVSETLIKYIWGYHRRLIVTPKYAKIMIKDIQEALQKYEMRKNHELY